MTENLVARIERFRTLKANWDSYSARPISERAIEIAYRLVPVLTDWHVVPTVNGGIQFEADDAEIEILVDCDSLSIRQDSERIHLKGAVVETAVAWRKVYNADSRYALERAIDALIAFEEKQ